MGRTFIRQDAQIRQSVAYTDTTPPTQAAYETNPTNIETDLNNLRSQLQNFLNRSAAGFPSGNWYDDITQPTALENGAYRGINSQNAALHLIEKKRVLRDVWKILDIYPGLDLAIALANDIKAKYNAHIPHLTYHSTADTTNGVTAADATTLASAITLANEIKADYNAHRTQAGVHPTDDTTNIVTAANATNLANLITLLNDIRTQYEAHRASATYHLVADTVNTISAPAVGSTTQVHIFTAAQLPLQTTAAIGAVTTLGTVAAQATTFGTAGLDEVASTSAINPKNMMQLIDAENHADPILIGGKQLFALFQTESATDGSTMTGTTPNRAQLSFVVRNNDGDDLELVSVPVTQGFNYATRERKRLEDLDEQDFLKGATIEFPASTTVTRQVAYDNQGVTPVEMATNSYLDLGIGLEWTIRDVLNAALLRAIEGSSGGASTIQLTSDVDVFDVNAVLNDFLNGIKVDTGAAGTTIQIGVTANQIDSGGALTLASGGGADLTLSAALELIFTDSNKAGSTFAGPLKLSETSAEWSNYETEFGEVSLLNAIYQAKTTAKRVKGYAVVTQNIPANTDASLTTNNNLDADLPDYSRAGLVFVDDCDVYLNGELLRNGANAAANHDVYPGTTPANGMLKFEFPLVASPGNPDTLCMIVWGS